MGCVNVKSNVGKESYVIRYHEMLKRKLAELRTDEHSFFKAAHVFLFGTAPDLMMDVVAYRQGAIIPVYVQRYLDTMEVT